MKDTRAVQRLFELADVNEIVAISAPNFCGSSYLLRHLLPDHNISTSPQSSLARHQYYYVGPEAYFFLSGFCDTVRDELSVFHQSGLDIAAGFFKSVGINHTRFIDRNPFTLSGGEQMLVAIALGLTAQPRYLALDKSLDQVDEEIRTNLLDYVRASHSNEKTNLFLIGDPSLNTSPRLGSYLLAHDEITEPLDRVLPFHPLDPEQFRVTPITSCNILAEGITFGYDKEKQVVCNCHLQLGGGRIYALKGSNGAGKSTLSKILSGVLKPSSGRFMRNGMAFVPWKEPGRGFAYHFQNPDVQLFMTTVIDEVGAGLEQTSLPLPERKRRIDSVLRTFGLHGIASQHPADLPFAMRKRVALAATFVTLAPWIILDEPTLAQDEDFADALKRIVMRSAASGTGIIIISHSQRFVKSVGAIDLILKDGRIVN